MTTDWCRQQLEILAGCIKDLSCMVNTDVRYPNTQAQDEFIKNKLESVYEQATQVEIAVRNYD